MNFYIRLFFSLNIISLNLAYADVNLSQSNLSAVSESGDLYQQILQKYVDAQGKVDYTSLKKEHQKLKTVLQNFSRTKLATLNKNGQMAFWINVYNAATIDLVLQNYPIKSIKDIAKGNVWDKKLSYTFNNESLSLNEIEHKKLLHNFADARIHFAINCASISCPPLSNAVFTAENVQQQLQTLTNKFINHSTYNKILPKVKISPIFKWYVNDFKKDKGSVVAFINQYLHTKKIEENTAIEYLDYNWNLNTQ